MNTMTIRELKTKELTDELISRGAYLIEDEAYKNVKPCICKEKYSHSADVKVLKKVLVLNTIQEVD